MILFTTALTVFYYKLSTVHVEDNIIDRWRFGIFSFGVIYNFVFRISGIDNNVQRQFLLISEIVLILTFIIIDLVYFLIITRPYYYMMGLDFITAIVTLIIIISAGRHGFFNEN